MCNGRSDLAEEPKIEPQTVVSGAMMLALGTSLQFALAELANLNGRQVGPWLDELEKNVFGAQKGRLAKAYL